MPRVQANNKSLFLAALEIESDAERSAFLSQACGGNQGLRAEIECLLKAHGDPPKVLQVHDDPEHTFRHARFEGSVAAIEGPGAVIGPYKLLQEIGQGGMGVVYMAEQTERVRRKVALKIIKPGMDSRQVIARFEAERHALSLMDHPNIARAIDAGATETGRPYFVMELVKGQPITQYCDEKQLSPRRRLELFLPVCQAIQHAHQKGIIHRDIKPSNILVAEYDQQPVPKVIDFGVAKAISQPLTDKTMFTGFGQIIGTIEYMSPEQAKVNQLDIDTRSDIYSLGVLMYELLTGATPFDKQRLRSATWDEMLRIIREEEPPKPSTRLSECRETLPAVSAHRRMEPAKLTKLVRGELDWIVMKALEKDRSRRYETANGLCYDIQRYLNDEPVLACPPSAAYRLRKMLRRNKTALAAAAVLGLAAAVMLAGLASSLFARLREQQATTKMLKAETAARGKMQAALEIERRAVEKAQREAYYQNITLAHYELSVDNSGRARKHLNACPPALRRWEWRYLQRLCLVEPLVLQSDEELSCVAFDSRGDRLVSGDIGGKVRIWDSRSGRLLDSFTAHSQSVVSLALHDDGRHLATAGLDRLAKVWDLTTGEECFSEPCDAVHIMGTSRIIALGEGPDSSDITFGVGGVVQVWDWRTQRLKYSFDGHLPRSIGVAYSRDGRFLATGDWRGDVRLWDARRDTGGEPLRVFTESSPVRHPATAVAFSRDGRLLAAGSFDRRVDVWEVSTGKRRHVLPHGGLVTCVAFSPDGRMIATSGEDKTVHLWDAATGREVLGLRGHGGHCGSVAFSPDGERLASASRDKTIRIWDATKLVGNEAQELLTFREHGHEIWSLAVSPDGQHVASAGFSTPAKVWNLRTGRTAAPDFLGHRDLTFCVAWHPGGERLASAGSLDGQMNLKFWELRTGLESFPGAVSAGSEVLCAKFLPPDGRYLVFGRADGSAYVWDEQTGLAPQKLTHGDMVRGIAFDESSGRLATLGISGSVKLWDWNAFVAADGSAPITPRVLSIKALVPGPGNLLDFSPDGRLAAATPESTVQIWDVEADQPLVTLRGHSDDVYALAFSPDARGRWIATASADSTVRVWDSRAGQRPVRTFRGHTGVVTSLAFTPDGRRLVSGGRDRTARVWDVSRLAE